LAGIATLILAVHDPEPKYLGRSLYEWQTVWSKAVEFSDSPQSQAQAREAAQAIRALGTNAIPTLLKSLRNYPSDRRLQIGGYLMDKLPDSVSQSPLIQRLFSGRGGVEPTSIFVILGALGSSAVPELNALLRATNINREVSRSAAFCLAAIGEEGLPPLLNALTNPQLPCCYLATDVLSIVPLNHSTFRLGTNIAQAVPALARNALSSDAHLACASIKALGHLKSQPQIAIPALVKCFDSPDLLSPVNAVSALARFGPEGVEPLRAALNHQNINVRTLATNVLRNLATQSIATPPL
jgi:HEAT repeat protein